MLEIGVDEAQSKEVGIFQESASKRRKKRQHKPNKYTNEWVQLLLVHQIQSL